MSSNKLSRRAAAATTAAALAVPFSTTAEAASMPDHLATMHALIKDWQRKDIDAVLARVTDDIEWHYLVGLAPLKGKAAMREMLLKFAPVMNDVKWRFFKSMQNANTLLVEGVDEYMTDTGHHVVVPYMGTYEFRDGLISGWRDYCDSGIAGRLKNGEAVPAYVTTLTSRKAI